MKKKTVRKEIGERASLGNDDRRIMALVDQYERERLKVPGLTPNAFIQAAKPAHKLQARLRDHLRASNLLTATGSRLRRR